MKRRKVNGSPEVVELFDSEGNRYVQLRFTVPAARRFFIDANEPLIRETCEIVGDLIARPYFEE